ncbi:MAG: T9SS type A sorting domain-containing protein [Bacteroidota bacterium]|jgi:hypothetical protein
MRKLVLTFAGSLAILAANAQQFESKQKNGTPANIPAKAKAEVYTKSGVDVSDWYNPIDLWARSSVGSQFTAANRFVNFIMHDSLAKYVDDDGSVDYGVGATSVGQILDPKDQLISSTDNPGLLLSGYVKYTLDSLRFTYLYVRNTDSTQDELGQTVPVYDTLFIAYFQGNQIQKNPFSTTNLGLNARVGWTPGTVRMPTNYFKLDTIVFGPGTTDSTRVNNNNGFENSWSLKGYAAAAPSGMNVNPTVNPVTGAVSNDLIGATLTFKAGVKSVRTVDLGGGNTATDTAVMIYQLDKTVSPLPAGTRRTNYFGFLMFQNPQSSGVQLKNEAFTNSLLTYPRYAYPTSGNDALGYIPGHFFNAQTFVDIDFHITSTSGNVGLADHELVSIGNLFPNPASSFTTVTFNSLKSGNVTVSLTNLVGQEVSALNVGKLGAGVNQVKLNLDNVKPGIYFVNVTVDGATTTKKLTITE